jgi:uncharacterized protein (DUF4415 family)
MSLSLRSLKKTKRRAREQSRWITLHLDTQVIAALQRAGKGWQTRVNDELRAAFRLTGKLS